MGLNAGAVYWIDMAFFALICCKNCIVSLGRPKINKKEAGVCPFKKDLVLRITKSSQSSNAKAQI